MAYIGTYTSLCLSQIISALLLFGFSVMAVTGTTCRIYPSESATCDTAISETDLDTQLTGTHYMVVNCEQERTTTTMYTDQTTAVTTTLAKEINECRVYPNTQRTCDTFVELDQDSSDEIADGSTDSYYMFIECDIPETTVPPTTTAAVTTVANEPCRIYRYDKPTCDQLINAAPIVNESKVDYNAQDTFFLIVDCDIHDPIGGLDVAARKDESGNYLVEAPEDSESGYLQFSLTAGSAVSANATVSGVVLDDTDVTLNQTTLKGSVKVSGIGYHNLQITLSNQVSTVTKNITIHLEEEIIGLYLGVEEPIQVTEITTFTASVTSGSNVVYTFCVKENHADETSECYDAESTGVLKYTFVHAGEGNVTVTADNGPSQSKKSAIVQVVDIVAGYTMTVSHPEVYTTDDVDLTLHAPDDSFFPMGQMYMILLRDGQNLKEPGLLEIQPSENLIILTSTFTPPGYVTVLAMITNVFSVQNVTVDFKVGDPINAKMSLDKSQISTGVPLKIALSNVAGWGFEYTMDFGDEESEKSASDAITQTYAESIYISHTYSDPGSFEIKFVGSNAIHEQTLTDNILVQHPVPQFTVNSVAYITIPDGWATFEPNPNVKDSPIPTEASCTIDYGDDTEVVNKVDWITGFPSAHKYEIFGKFTMDITCSNLISSEEASFDLEVGDRDVDIQGLNIEIPQFSLINSPTEIKVSIERGSNVIYDVTIGAETETVSDKGGLSEWTMSHTFTVVEIARVSVIAQNAVNELTKSTSTSVVKPTSGFKLTAHPTVVDTEEEITLVVRAPESDAFPMGPVAVKLLYSDGTSLWSSDVTPEPGKDMKIKFNRWAAGNYEVTAIVESPVSQEKLKTTVVVEAPIPFFSFTSKSIITIPDGVVSIEIRTRPDEPRPTSPVCSVQYDEDGPDEDVVWSYDIALSHTYAETDQVNITFACHNRISRRSLSRQINICELSADGFRFDYPRVVPLNSSSSSVLVLFKYNLCGLQSAPPNTQMSWVFEENTAMELEETWDWEAEHYFHQRKNYEVRVFIKTIDTNTETTVTLPLRIGVLSVASQTMLGRTKEDEFRLQVSGAFGEIVNFLVDFGEGKNVTGNGTNMEEEDIKTFRKVYNTAGTFGPRVIAWNKDFVEERVLGENFLVQYPLERFEIDVEQETWQPPISTVFNVRLPYKMDPSTVSCVFDLGDGSIEEIVNFNPYVVRHYALRLVHRFPSYGPFEISATCSNRVSNFKVSDKLLLRRSGSAKATSFLFCVLMFGVIGLAPLITTR